MKKILFSTALAGLLATSGAVFAQGHRDHGGPDGHPGPPAGHTASGTPMAQGRHDQGGPPGGHPPAAAPAGRSDNRHFDGNRTGARGFQRGNRPNFTPNRNSGPRQNFSAWHRNFNAPRHFHAPGYRRPSGWYSHRWTYGEFLPSLFWSQDYWLNDFNDFGLTPPPPGTVWVRDGDDALLIDRFSGEIVQVAYGVFY